MRDFWKPMPVSGKLIRELLLLFLLFWVQQSYAQRITRTIVHLGVVHQRRFLIYQILW